MSKVVLMSYHKNLHKLYPSTWIEEGRLSVENQTFKDFQIFEIDYGNKGERIFESSNYQSLELPSFIHAMNYLIDIAICYGADAVVNLNCDDFYAVNRLEVQVPFIKAGFDVVSSNFCLLRDDKIYKYHHFDKLNIKEELNKNHNPVGHPSVIYSKHFLQNNRYIPEEFPFEDMLLWKRTIDNYKFKIVSENLLYHRIHDNSVCKSENR